MDITSQEFLNKLMSMPQDQAIQFLMSNPEFAKLVIPNNYETLYSSWGTPVTPTYLNNDNGGWVVGPDESLVRDRNATYSTALTPSFDPNYGGGVYGSYFGSYDSEGNLTGVDFRKQDRHDGWFNENLETIGPLLVAAAMGAGGGLFGGTGAEAGAAPIVESAPSWVAGDAGVTGAIAGGMEAPLASSAVGSAVAPITASAPSWVATTATAAAPSAASTLLQQIFGPQAGQALSSLLGGAGPLLGGLANSGINYAAANRIKNDLTDLGNSMKDEYNGAFDYIKSKGEFTPWAMRNPIVSVDKQGNVEMDADFKNMFNASNQVGLQSFEAAKGFDYEKNAQDEYDLMMKILGPDFEREQLATEARMARQGRLGLDNAPELNALEKAQADQRLKAMLSARSTGLQRRGEMINQGTAAYKPSMDAWQLIQQLQGLSGQMGGVAANAQANQNNTLANLFNNRMGLSTKYDLAGATIANTALTSAAQPIGNAAQSGVNTVWDWLFK